MLKVLIVDHLHNKACFGKEPGSPKFDEYRQGIVFLFKLFRLCQMMNLFKNSNFLVHFCWILGVLDYPRVPLCGLFFKIIKGLNRRHNYMLS